MVDIYFVSDMAGALLVVWPSGGLWYNTATVHVQCVANTKRLERYWSSRDCVFARALSTCCVTERGASS
jgi:hypothetical protein